MNYENLIFGGGGVRGIAFYGVIKYLHDHNLIKKFKRFAGTSAGAVAAIAMACKFPIELIKEVLFSTDFTLFEDDDYGIFRDSARLIHKYGWHKGNYIGTWMRDILQRATGIADITFQQIYNKFGTELVITGTCVNTAETIYYSRKTCCDRPVWEALRISMGIPLFFKAVKENDMYYVDGGHLSNYPIWIFDNDGNIRTEKSSICNEKTLGVKVLNDHEDQSSTNIKHDISNILEFAECLISCMQIEIDKLSMTNEHWKHTIPIKCGNISSIDFNIDNSGKEKLSDMGYEQTLQFFETNI